jgi:pimeloyl-ACP methyl ester carboxylesterase
MLRKIQGFLSTALLVGLLCTSAIAAVAKPTIILVHGAFADGSSWNGVISDLANDGYPVIAPANPLRGVASDATYLAEIIKSVKGPVVLVGHSYGGAVISAAANDAPNVKELVYVAAFAPEAGESSLQLSGKFPGSTLDPTLAPPVDLAGGGQDLYIQQSLFPHQFAADLHVSLARLLAATQRPVTKAALAEPSGAPAWKTKRSWSIYGSADLNIPPAALAFMAERARAKKTVVVKGASHLVMVSHPHEVSALIEEAAKSN